MYYRRHYPASGKSVSARLVFLAVGMGVVFILLSAVLQAREVSNQSESEKPVLVTAHGSNGSTSSSTPTYYTSGATDFVGKQATLSVAADTPFLTYKFYAGGIGSHEPYLNVVVSSSGQLKATYASYTTFHGTYTFILSPKQLAHLLTPILDTNLLLSDQTTFTNEETFSGISGSRILHPSTSILVLHNASVSASDNKQDNLTGSATPKEFKIQILALSEESSARADDVVLSAIASLAKSLDTLAETASGH
jgi:hypothetical protein